MSSRKGMDLDPSRGSVRIAEQKAKKAKLAPAVSGIDKRSSQIRKNTKTNPSENKKGKVIQTKKPSNPFGYLLPSEKPEKPKKPISTQSKLHAILGGAMKKISWDTYDKMDESKKTQLFENWKQTINNAFVEPLIVEETDLVSLVRGLNMNAGSRAQVAKGKKQQKKR